MVGVVVMVDDKVSEKKVKNNKDDWVWNCCDPSPPWACGVFEECKAKGDTCAILDNEPYPFTGTCTPLERTN